MAGPRADHHDHLMGDCRDLDCLHHLRAIGLPRRKRRLPFPLSSAIAGSKTFRHIQQDRLIFVMAVASFGSRFSSLGPELGCSYSLGSMPKNLAPILKKDRGLFYLSTV